MDALIKKITIQDTRSKFYNQTVDILVENNVIVTIDDAINVSSQHMISGEGLAALPCFVDILSKVGEPGLEHHETIKHATKAAASGGYGYVFTSPYNQPAVDNGSMVMTMKQLFAGSIINFNTMGSIVKANKPNELANVLEMHEQGVQLFTLPTNIPIDDAVLLKAMEFVTVVNGTLVVVPSALYLFPSGQMHEGKMSAGLGMKGFPTMSEEVVVQKLIKFVAYTNAKLHIAGITAATVLPFLSEAKASGLPITCSVSPNHLLYTDASLHNYDTNFKLNPPLRTEGDRVALIHALETGVIDSVLTHHAPVHADEKDGEFDKAQFGTTGLQTAFYMLRKAMPHASLASIATWLGINNAAIAQLNLPSINIGEKALFNMVSNYKWQLTKSEYHSKSYNHPMLNEWFNEKITLL